MPQRRVYRDTGAVLNGSPQVRTARRPADDKDASSQGRTVYLNIRDALMH
jgi:hypothetical protein